MIVVVEGPDNAGKTTLAAWLAKQLRAAYVKVERPKSGVDPLAFHNILEVAEGYSGWVVADRHVAISEPIYGGVIRGGHDLKSEDVAFCLDRIDFIIYCRPPIPVILRTIAERPQMEGVVENTHKLIIAYDRLCFELTYTGKHIYRYDFVNNKPETVLPLLNRHRS